MGKKHRFKDKKERSFFSKVFSKIKNIYKKLIGRNEKKGKLLVGVIDHCNPDFAFVVVKGSDKDIFVHSKDMLSAIDGDTVLVSITNKKKKENLSGRVVKVLERKYKFFVGTIKNDGKNNFYLDTKIRNIYNKIIIDKESVGRDMLAGSRVKVSIIKYPDSKFKKDFFCKIEEVFGLVGDHESEMRMIINSCSLPECFPDEVLEEANKIEINTEEELKHRRDFRDVFTVTIDPDTAKDFDDAISFQKLDEDKYELGIHIADVSYFVQEKTFLDKEAYKRSTSVYLIDRVIPMLPERLCNDLCSLVEGQERLTMSIVFEVNSKGEILKEWIGETVIKSDCRMTYAQAQEAIENPSQRFHKQLSVLYKISAELRKKRFEKGAINFNFDDIGFGIDQSNALKITREECRESHNMIEEFMLLANEHVAMWVANIKVTQKSPVFIYRTHDAPLVEKINDFCMLMQNFKIRIDNNPQKFPTQLNNLLEQIKGRDDENVISTLAVRTMQRAVYSTKPLGHFGLAFKHYTHFTSPIRRYVDIVVHRLLKKYIEHQYEFDYHKYEKLCAHANTCEGIATDAERESIKFKQVEFLSNHIGEKYEGIVTGLTETGMFVEVKEIRCDGFLRFSECKYDYYHLDRNHGRVLGDYTGNIYCIGDPINVIIKNCNIERRLVDFTFV